MGSVDDMILFAEVAETGSFTKAAIRVGVPKSTVSQRIAELEKALGLRLLNRSTRQVSLTHSGSMYLEHCRRVRTEVSAAHTAMTNLKDQPVGTLKITCPEVTATYFMPAFLRGFIASCPRVAVVLAATNKHLDIIRERIDFAFRVGVVSSRDLVVRKISKIRRVLVAAPAYVAANAPIEKPNDLLQHRCLVHDSQPSWDFASGSARFSVRVLAATASDSLGFLLHSSILGGGVALLPAYVCQSALAAGQLVEVVPGWNIPPYDMVMVSPNAKNQSNAQSAFRKYVRDFDFSQLSNGRQG